MSRRQISVSFQNSSLKARCSKSPHSIERKYERWHNVQESYESIVLMTFYCHPRVAVTVFIILVCRWCHTYTSKKWDICRNLEMLIYKGGTRGRLYYTTIHLLLKKGVQTEYIVIWRFHASTEDCLEWLTAVLLFLLSLFIFSAYKILVCLFRDAMARLPCKLLMSKESLESGSLM